MITSGHPNGLVTMVLGKITQETVIQDILPLLQTVPLPELKTPSTLVDGVVNCVGWATINNTGRRQGLVWRDQIRLRERLDLRNVEKE